MKFAIHVEGQGKLHVDADSADDARAKVRKARPKCIITKTKAVRHDG